MTKREQGFTVVEMLVVVALTGILMTLGAFAVRHYWLVQSLHGSRDDVVTQLRRLQEQVVSESHPLVFGARFKEGSPQWGLVEFDPRDTTLSSDGTCKEVNTLRFGTGVEVESASFASAPVITNACATQLPGASTDDFVFFYARGTATSGQVTITQTSLDRDLSASVFPITGRVEAN